MGRSPTRVIDGTKFCIGDCGEWKPLSEFHRSQSSATGTTSYCKPCNYNRVILHSYGMTGKQYTELYNKQNGKCLICCEEHERQKLHVDHDPKTREIRGLLCRRCNTFLGYVHESIEILERAIKYVNKTL